MPSEERTRVAVFIDGQNTWHAAREAFGWTEFPNEYGNYSPLRLARLLTEGNGRGARGLLVRVNIHRGLPSNKRDPQSYGAVRRQAQAWIAEGPDIVVPRLRPVRYYGETGEPREKGVDVDMAIEALRFVLGDRCDVAVLFTHDTDLIPAVEAIADLEGVSAAACLPPRARSEPLRVGRAARQLRVQGWLNPGAAGAAGSGMLSLGMSDVAIADVLRGLGLEGEEAALARTVLELAGLTNPRKQRVSLAKVGRVATAIDAELARLCRRCATEVEGERRLVVIVPSEACARCGGSASARALQGLLGAARAAGVQRIVLVGGSPDVRRELGRLQGPLELRLVDGTERRTGAEARRDVEWADVVVVAGASELAHKVSLLYTREPAARGKLVTVPRRSVEAIAGEVVRHLELRRV